MKIKWTDDEINYLKNNINHITISEAARTLQRNKSSIRAKLRKMGLTFLSQKENIISKLKKIEMKLVGEYIDQKTKTEFLCPYCKNTFLVTPDAVLQGQKSCGCYKSNQKKGTKNISGYYWGVINRGAIKRNIDLTITIEYIDELIVQQKFKCALTGWNIIAGYIPATEFSRHTASLDRLDNSIGYHEGNVQWVHSSINISKGFLNNDRYIEICKTIYNNYIIGNNNEHNKF